MVPAPRTVRSIIQKCGAVSCSLNWGSGKTLRDEYDRYSTLDYMEHGRLSSNGYNTAYYISIAERSVFIVVSLEIFRIPVQDNAKITFANMYTSRRKVTQRYWFSVNNKMPSLEILWNRGVFTRGFFFVGMSLLTRFMWCMVINHWAFAFFACFLYIWADKRMDMNTVKKKQTLEDSYKKIMKNSSFVPSPLFQKASKDGLFESVLRPDYSNYSTSSVTSKI